MATTRKRASYTAEYKLFVAKKAEQLGNREAGRIFNIDEKNIRMWRKSVDSLVKVDKQRKANRGRAPYWPLLEHQLLQWLLELRDSGTPLTLTDILTKARSIANEMGVKDFGCKTGWCYRFLRRKNLKLCDGMLFDESLPLDWETKAQSFHKILEDCVKKSNYGADDVVVIDEIGITLDPAKEPDLNSDSASASKRKFSFRVVIGCCADGSKLKPLIIFRTKDDPFGEDFPDGVEVEASEKGFLDANVMREWFEIVWKRRKGNRPPNGVLIIDSKKAHILSEMKRICGDAGTEVLVIPEGLTMKLHPLNFGLSAYFQRIVKFLWKKQATGEFLLPSLQSDNSNDTNLTEIAEWVKEAWSLISSKVIKLAFLDSGIVKPQTATPAHGETSDNKNTSMFLNGTLYVEDMYSSDSNEFDFECFQ